MLIAGLDIETTGLLTPDHRVIEVYVGLWDDASKSLIRHFETRIDPQRSIAADAQRVHGISASALIGKPTWDRVADQVRKIIHEADLVVAHNGEGFDGPFLDQEFKRVGLEPIQRPLFDTMLQGRWATHNGKVPNLGELCFACGVPYDPAKAHAASYDVHRMVDCFFFGLRTGWFKPKLPARSPTLVKMETSVAA